MREVKVTLLSEHSGAMIESGMAVKNADGAWGYRNTLSVADVGGVSMRVTTCGEGIR
jgi:hypothetical protein